MADERMAVTGSELARWAIIAILVAGGLAAALWLAPQTRPLAPPLEEAGS